MKSNTVDRMKKEQLRLIPFYIFYILLTLYVSENIFYWDTIQLGAEHGSFFHETNFSRILLPDEMDSGHIPAFGVYLALVWKIFGKTLFVSHLAMLPFLLGIVLQSYMLINRFISNRYVVPALALFLADPTLLGQSVLISPDIPLVFFTLLSLNAALNLRRGTLVIGLAGLVLTSTRGLMVASAIFMIDIFFNVRHVPFRKLVFNSVKTLKYYAPALLIFFAYNLYHYLVKGWIGYHEESPWAECFQVVGFSGFLYNIGILGWRLFDFGRIFLWLAVAVIVIRKFRSVYTDRKAVQLIVIVLLFLVNLSISFTIYKTVNAHRYILPVYLAFALLAGYLIFEKIRSEKIKYSVFVLVIAGLLTGHFWIYPEKISQGWDASLAHLPYYGLRKEMLQYIEEKDIRMEDIGCVFPNKSSQKYLELNDDSRKHVLKDLDTNRYVLYSNSYNNFTDEEIDRLNREFILVKEWKKNRIFLRLYKNNEDR